MLQKLLLTCLMCGGAALSAWAQQTCVIEGTFTNDRLRHTDKAIDKVYLNRMDEMENLILVDSAQVSDGKFTLNHALTDYHGAEVYLLTGFDNGNSVFFVEPGTVTLRIDAAYPIGARATGTPANDLYEEYKKIAAKCTQTQIDSLRAFNQSRPAGWLDSNDGVAARARIGGEAKMRTNLERTRFLLDHNDSALAPLMMRKELLYTLSDDAANDLRQSVSPSLEQHPYTEAFSNAVLARHIDIGSELPNIVMPTTDGKKLTLKDFRGKYVLLDFWASWCGPCRKEIPNLKAVYEKFASKGLGIVSISIDKDAAAWQKALEEEQLPWRNFRDETGVADAYSVSAIPAIFLVDGSGTIIATGLRGTALQEKLETLLP